MRRLVALLAWFALAPVPAPAQGFDGAGLSDRQTTLVTEVLAEGLASCGELDIAYRFDCFRETTRAAARRVSSNAAYWEVEIALTRISRNLGQWVQDFRDPDAASIRHDGARRTAVSASAIPSLTAATRRLIEDAAGNIRRASGREGTYFEPIADLIEGQTLF
ncbi:MAG: hypothetical protein EP307_14390 [Rhodobacteraceae bacterium]|nr:MAG: hypothetical protein EP307_14390 [Paracoccaceae bacterium]